MSQTLYVDFRGDGFWAFDVVSSVFLKHMIDVASDSAVASEPWLAETIQNWRVNAVISDMGLFLEDDWSEKQIETVIDICGAAVTAIRSNGDMSAAEIQSEPLIDNMYIFVRGIDPIPASPVARFGEAMIALLRNKLPTPPAKHWWFYSLADEVRTIEMASDA
jgi:hypothetical protein